MPRLACKTSALTSTQTLSLSCVDGYDEDDEGERDEMLEDFEDGNACRSPRASSNGSAKTKPGGGGRAAGARKGESSPTAPASMYPAGGVQWGANGGGATTEVDVGQQQSLSAQSPRSHAMCD